MSATIGIDKDILSEFTVGSVGDVDGDWELVEHEVTGEWRHGNTYRIVVWHENKPDGYYAYDWQDQQNGEWSSFNDEPDPVELYRVEPREVTTVVYERVRG